MQVPGIDKIRGANQNYDTPRHNSNDNFEYDGHRDDMNWNRAADYNHRNEPRGAPNPPAGGLGRTFERSFRRRKVRRKKRRAEHSKINFKFYSPGIYNTETKKFWHINSGGSSACRLILMIADSDENDDLALLIALVYIFMA